MRRVIVCKSVHHGNTDKIAGEICSVLNARLMQPEEITAENVADYELVGFGSGIYGNRHHRSITALVKNLPEGKDKKVFLFSTSGLGKDRCNNRLKRILSFKGYAVIGSFACKGYDTFGPFKLIGGINKGRPDDRDMEAARRFALEMEASLKE